jgi:acyl-CoA dehydrogenase
VDFELTPEQLEVLATVQAVNRRFDLNYWRDKDKNHAFAHEFWSALREAGLTGAMVPEAYGGAGLGLHEAALVIDELASGGSGVTGGLSFILGPIFGGFCIARHGTSAQKERYLTALAAGRLKVSLGLSEPDSGSDALAMTTRARRSEKGWVIRGRKMWTTGANMADLIIVAARTDDAERHTQDGITLFLVDAPNPQIVLDPVDKVGLHTMPSFSMALEDVAVPAEAVLGEVGQGWSVLVDILNPERVAVTATATGTGRLLLDLAVQYASERRAFGRPIGSNQAVQFPLAQWKAYLENAKLMNLHAAWRFDRGLPCSAESLYAKLLGTRAACGVADQAMQTMGGFGYSTDYHVERYWRDLRLFRSAPVSEEMTLAQIAHNVLQMPRSF